MPRTTPSSTPTAASGSPIPATAPSCDYEGHKGTLEIKEAVYRIDPTERQVRQGHRRPLQTQRPVLLARLQDALHRRHRRVPLSRGAPEHPRLRRRRRYEAHPRARVRLDEDVRRPAAIRPASPTASAATPRATSTRPAAGSDPAMTASTSSPPTASASGRSSCRRSVPTSVSAGPSATASSWPPASRSTPFTSTPAAGTSPERAVRRLQWNMPQRKGASVSPAQSYAILIIL